MINEEELKKFWDAFTVMNPLANDNEVYCVSLMKESGSKRVVDTIFVKTMEYEDFSTKVKWFVQKMIAYSAENPEIGYRVYIDVNPKNVAEGLLKGWRTIERRIYAGKDVKYYTQVFARAIRHSPARNFSVIVSTKEHPDAEIVVVDEESQEFYNILSYTSDEPVHFKFPVPGVRKIVLRKP